MSVPSPPSVTQQFSENLITIHGAEIKALKKYDNITPQKPSNMLSYSPGHAAKIGGKKSDSKLTPDKGGLHYARGWWKMKKNKRNLILIKFIKILKINRFSKNT